MTYLLVPLASILVVCNALYTEMIVSYEITCPLRKYKGYAYRMELWEIDFYKYGDLITSQDGFQTKHEPLKGIIRGLQEGDEVLLFGGNWEVQLNVYHNCTRDGKKRCDGFPAGHCAYSKKKCAFVITSSLTADTHHNTC